MSLTEDRNTKERQLKTLNAPIAASMLIYAGALVALNATGYLVPGSESDALSMPGRAKEQINNAGADGDLTAEYELGCFQYANSAAADEITRADIGNDCYIVDDETVAKTSNTDARSVAGKIVDLDDSGVWVSFT